MVNFIYPKSLANTRFASLPTAKNVAFFLCTLHKIKRVFSTPSHFAQNSRF